MSQQTEQDLHARIARLAEAEWDCPDYCRHGEKCGGFHSALNVCGSCPGEPEPGHRLGHHPIIPFRALRWVPVPDLERACWHILVAQAERGVLWYVRRSADGLWSILGPLPGGSVGSIVWAAGHESGEEAVIAAAEAWLGEQER